MRYLMLGALAILASSGCVVVHDHPRHRPAPPPPPPPAATTVTVTYGWHHHRHVVWTEYYSCSNEDIYYLENCGYDDDDVLVCLYIARHARVHPRYVFYEYDRCGRNLFAVSMYYRLPFGIWFVNDIPHGYACPGVYSRCYGYYWGGQHHYYTNAELHALVHLQIGVRYYGYSHATYFDHYQRGYQRNDPHPFRTIAVQDHRKAGYGGKTVDHRPIVKQDRPWDHRDVKEWDRKREVERQQIKMVHTPQKEREEQEKVKRESESPDRRQAADETRRRVEDMKKARVESDRKMPDPPGRGPAAAEGPTKGPDPRRPTSPATEDSKPKGPAARPEPRGPEPKVTEPKGPPPRGPEPKSPAPRAPEPRGPEPKGPPPKGPDGPQKEPGPKGGGPQEERGGGNESKERKK